MSPSTAGANNHGIGTLTIKNNRINGDAPSSGPSSVHGIVIANIKQLDITGNHFKGFVGLRTITYGGQNPSGQISFTDNKVDTTHGIFINDGTLPTNGLKVDGNEVGPNTSLIKPSADTASIVFKFNDGVTKDEVHVVPNTTATIPVPDTQRKGYQFGGWYNRSHQKVALNGNQLHLNQFNNTKADDKGIDEVLTASWIPGMTVPPITNSPEVTAPTTSTTPTTSSSPNTETEKPTTSKNPVPRRAVKVGGYLYLIKGASLYRSADFSNGNRLSKFAKQTRTKRPVFKVLAYAFSNAGNFRYKVVDQNRGSKTYKKTGYVTGASGYSSNLYYTTMPQSKRIQVINAKGIYQYKNANLANRRDRIAKGKTLRIKKVTTGNATRYQLTNGNYISANKRLVIWK